MGRTLATRWRELEPPDRGALVAFAVVVIMVLAVPSWRAFVGEVLWIFIEIVLLGLRYLVYAITTY